MVVCDAAVNGGLSCHSAGDAKAKHLFESIVPQQVGQYLDRNKDVMYAPFLVNRMRFLWRCSL